MKKAPKKGKKAKIARPIAEIPSAWQSTSEIAVPERIIDQVIGQDNCVELIKKAAMQKRNVLLVGLPGTGKSMLAQAMAEILPMQKMQDILVYPNSLDSNNPKVKIVDAGKGKQIVNTERMNALAHEHSSRMLAILFPIGFFILSSFMWSMKWISDVIFAATIILGGILLMGFVVASQMRMRFSHETPKLLIDNSEKKTAPFIEATGARAGSLLGDCLHDPLQSGGLGTPAHLRVECGAIHRANGGVLFLDEIATLSPKAQQELLTAMQEKKYPITGQSENSSGAMVRSEPVPCFPGETRLLTTEGNIAMGKFIDMILSNNSDKVVVKNGVEFLDLDMNKNIMAYSNGKIMPSRLERVYRHKYSEKVLKIRFDDGTELIATPEHPIKTVDGFAKAEDLKVNDAVEAINNLYIINERAIISTYSEDNQKIANAFNRWIISGKRLSARALNVDYKTVSSWKKGAIPHALKAVQQLSKKKLLPLTPEDDRLPKIARVAGALFGDGGIDGKKFSRLYFCTGSDGTDDLNEFKNDILSIFGRNTESAITIRKTTSKGGAGLELSVNNSSIARFFYSLGVPKGDKVSQSFSVPSWVRLSEGLEKEFFSSLLSCELYGNIRSSQDIPSFVMAKLKRFEKEHIDFLNEIRTFLLKNKVMVHEVKQDKEYFKTKGLPNPELAGTYLFRINASYKNLIKLASVINFYYAKNKKSAIFNAVNKGKIFISSQKHLTALKEKALILRNAGKTIRAISKETGLCKNTVLKLVGRTYNKYSYADRQNIFDLFTKGEIPKYIAKKFEIPYTTVLYWKNKYYGENVNVS